jgi:hypothetical protein
MKEKAKEATRLNTFWCRTTTAKRNISIRVKTMKNKLSPQSCPDGVNQWNGRPEKAKCSTHTSRLNYTTMRTPSSPAPLIDDYDMAINPNSRQALRSAAANKLGESGE